jgi:hypothetical protein
MERIPSVTGRTVPPALGDGRFVTRLVGAALGVSALTHVWNGEYWEGTFWAVTAAGAAASSLVGNPPMSLALRLALGGSLVAALVAVDAGTSPAVRAAGIALAVSLHVVNIWHARRRGVVA